MPVTVTLPDDRDLVSAYERLGSVRATAEELGVSHSRVHRRLTKIGVSKPINRLREDELAEIRAAYAAASGAPLDLEALSARLGRTRALIAKTACGLGLTDRSRPKSEKAKAAEGAAQRQRLATNGHPRGFEGRGHTAQSRAVMSAKSRDAWLLAKATGTGAMSEANRQRASDALSRRRASDPAENAYSRTKSGRREDLGGLFVRSAWEANYARYLNWLLARGEIEAWRYEPTTFWFEAIKRGVRSYKPDFEITEKGQTYFVEVKGWMDAKSATKLKRMKKYHPTVEVRVFGQKQYAELSRKLGRVIPNWEGKA